MIFTYVQSHAEGARENFGIFDKKIKILVDLLSKFLEFGRKYSPVVEISAAGAKNWEFWPSRSQNSTL